MSSPAAALALPPAGKAWQRAAGACRQWLGRLALALAVSSGVAFMLSLQFLAQPFVWQNWPLLETLEGWAFVLRDRLIVATLIATGVVLWQALPLRSAWLRSAALAGAILATALLGELIVQELDPFGSDSVLPRGVRWTLLSLAAAATVHVARASQLARRALGRESLRQMLIEQQLAHLRLAALRSQIEPHFLFNSLATIRHLQSADPAVGSHVLGCFVDYLRRMLSMVEQQEVRLADEVALIRAYLAIMSVRMTGRLRLTIDVPEALHAVAVPPLALATLVENAIKHGLTPAPQGGSLDIRARLADGLLQLSVTDTGVGLGASSSGPGIGLSNVRARLATLHGRRGSLQVAAHAPSGVQATIELPARSLDAST